jgi:L-amino acid N-acyltransferase YncA/DNA-directed RNA polymerase subunit RPC12/RpoP
MGLVVNQVNHFFNEYQGASILGGSSQLIHLLTSQATAPAIPESRYDLAIYTGEVSPTKRSYRCANCGARIEVGRDHAFNTIETLKAQGCPGCGKAQFRYEGRGGGQSAGEGQSTNEAHSASHAAGMGQIRPAKKEDLPAIVDFEIEIARISFPEDPITDPEVHRSKLSKIMDREPEGMYVLAAEGRIVGWLWITINTQPLTRRTYGTLRSLAVNRDWRRGGAGRALLEFGIDYCRKNRAEWMVTKVFAENLPMRTLCLNLGFHIKHLSMEMRFDA